MNTNSVDELKTIIALTGNKRLPHLEAEIFADNELTTFYLHNLCKHTNWYEHVDYCSNTWLAYCYSSREIGKWPEAESLIASTPESARRYACYVLGKRWPEAEAEINTDNFERELYNLHFGT